MSWWEILIIVAACAFVVGVAVWSIVRRKQGKSCCDCEGCPHCAACAKKRETQQKK